MHNNSGGASSRFRMLKLPPTVAFNLFGWAPQRCLTWLIVENTPHFTLDHLLKAGLTMGQLQQLNPSLAAWINAGRATLRNLADSEGWGCSLPIECPQINLEHCITIAGLCRATRLKELGLSLDTLLTHYNMQLAQMQLFTRYTMADWVPLGFDFAKHGMLMDPALFQSVFKTDMCTGHRQFEQIVEKQRAT